MDDVSQETGISEDTLWTSGSGTPTKQKKEQPKSKSKSRSRSKSKSRSRSKSKSRSKSRSKSPGKHKSRKSSKSQKRKDFGWWDLENDPELIAALEAEGLREKARIAEDEALMARRQEIVRKFMQQHIDDMEAEEDEKLAAAAAARTRGVALRFLQQVQQNERETKPVVLESVRAAPLKIDVSMWEAPKYKKDADEKALIKNTAKKHFLFKDKKDYMKQLSTSRSQKSNLNTGIASNTVAMMIKAFEPVRVDKGETIIQQGKLDEHLYVIDQGKVEFQVDDATVATGAAGTCFGDQNLLHSVPADRTVVATESTKVFRLHQETYRGILQQRHIVEDVKKKQKEKEQKEKEKKEKEEKERREKAKAKESDDSKSQSSEEKEKKIKKEKEAKKEKKKAKKAEETKSEEDSDWWKDEKSAQLQIAIRDALQKVHQDELERIRVLGEGQFGEVWLVAANLDIEDDDEQEPKRYEFALKLQETYDEYREETAISEIKVMKEVSGYPFVSMLYRSYETEESKDMLLGLIPGGELWDTIHQEDEETGEWLSGLSEGQSRFYALLVADTLDYLHSKSYVFRDLKPENIMLDGWGYPIIVDFGFCKRLKKGPSDKTFTFCGTPNYVSPEIVLNVGHNGAADCWALGIVIYEMIAGINPFFWDDMDQIELYRSICEDAGEPLSEKHHSRQVRKLVDALLTKDPDKRLDAKGILKNGWFEGLSLKRMRKRQVRAPWIPPGGQGETAEYFCDYTEDEATAAAAAREREVEEELLRLKKEEEERQRMREEEELERQRLLAEEQERLEEEERLREEEEFRRLEELRRLEEERLRRVEEERRRALEEARRLKELEEQRLREEEEERLRIEEELRLQREEEERLREEEEERLRLEEEERLREEEEQRLREEEEERLREEEEMQRKMEEELARIEEEELRVEEELRKQREAEERMREEEERRQRKMEELRRQRELEEKKRLEEEAERRKELRRQKVLEEQRLREEEEERRRQNELRRQRMLEEQQARKEEEERQQKLKEEEERLERELEEQQRRLDEEEQRQREIALRRRREMEELEQEIEEKEQENQQRRLEDEEQRQRDVAARRRMQLEAEMEKHERKIEWQSRRNTDNNFGERDYVLNKVNTWEESPVSTKRSYRSSDEISPVPKGYVSKSIDEFKRSPGSRKSQQSPGALDVRRSVKKGIVAKRLSAAKEKEEPGNIPSLFASFSILEKTKSKRGLS